MTERMDSGQVNFLVCGLAHPLLCVCVPESVCVCVSGGDGLSKNRVERLSRETEREQIGAPCMVILTCTLLARSK